jgi:hypothetical protein
LPLSPTLKWPTFSSNRLTPPITYCNFG